MHRSQYTKRPFILTRSHFASSQRYAAMWTGDNLARWDNLKISYPMCLTQALVGISFCGADIGGFGGIPTDELYFRWYQAGAWLPFFRGHSANDVPRREPYLFPKNVQDRVRRAIRQRYAHLPVWYTLFFNHHVGGEPVIRPLVYEYRFEHEVLTIDDQLLVGRDILVCPVLEEGVTSRKVYLPGLGKEVWYNIDENFRQYNTGHHKISVTYDSVPVFYRGGSIIVRRDKHRPSTVFTHFDPFTLYVNLGLTGEARGSLYIDDYVSFNYNQGHFQYIWFNFTNNTLNSKNEQNKQGYKSGATVGKIVIINPPQNVIGAQLSDEALYMTDIKTAYSNQMQLLVLQDLFVSLNHDFSLTLVLHNL